jgi:trehalose 6-phosphate phosphatase
VTPVLPPSAALLLDVDGTLIDIAPTPDAVVVPPELLATLHRLRISLEGALAVVTGRPVAQVDALLGSAPHAVAGEHGAAIRHAPGEEVERADVPAPPANWLERAEAVVASLPGTLLEPKTSGFVFHYRQAPECEDALHRAALEFAGELPGFKVLAAKMAWEIKPSGIDKGVAVAALMARPPFLGRVPVYIGDDVTDEDGIRAAIALGGTGWLVPEVFTDPAGVRRWLATLA